jgi:TonB family protein
MAMHLIDRPHFDHERQDHRGLSAAASMALHAAVIVTLVAALRVSTDRQVSTAAPFLLPDIVWIPSIETGGGRDGGGDYAVAPPRRARAIGADAIRVPASVPQQASTDSIVEPPPDVPALPARPTGDATQILVGAVHSNGPSAGPGESGAGTKPGSDRGLGIGRGPGIGDDISRGGNGVSMPTLIERVSPKYTADAMRARIQGSVWIECVVQTDGTVGDLRVMRSLDRHFGLDEEAIAAAKRWRFRPGMLNGKPVPVVVTIELSFSVR